MLPRVLRFVIPAYIVMICHGHVAAQQVPQVISFPVTDLPEEVLVGVNGYSGGTIFQTNFLANGSNAQTLKGFSPNGSKPTETLIDGGNDYLYGATTNGGSKSAGLIFRIHPDGSNYEIIHDFQESDGTFPSGGLLNGADGWLYGATELGGQFKYGVIYRLDLNGANFQLIHQFNWFDGSDINGDLIQDSNGTLFGMSTGGTSNSGTIFRLQPDGSGFQELHTFNGVSGATPYGGLTEGLDGKLYGMTYSGGSNQAGSIFRINKDGSSFSVIRNLVAAEGKNPFGRLVQDANGIFYGFAPWGGINDNGVIFKINPDGTGFQVLHYFIMPYGSTPRGSPVLRNGALYGATMGGLDPHSVIFTINTNGSGFELLHGVTAGWDKPTPQGTLLIRSDGTMYGTTTGLDVSIDGGIFRFNPATDEYDDIHSFEENEGNFPQELILAKNRRLYGVSTSGGINDAGLIYSIEPDGSTHLIHHQFQPPDGIKPLNALTQGPDGTLFGSTSAGGSNSHGTIYSIQSNGGGFQKLHDFESADGYDVRGQLVRDVDGFLFGLTMEGGVNGGGVVFKVHESGSDFQVLHSFDVIGGIEGSNPTGGLILGSDEVLYGTTYNGGTNGLGTIFSIHKDGSAFQKLFNFSAATGQHSSTRLIEGSQGNLIGLTVEATSFYNSMYSIEKDGSNFTLLKIHDYAAGNMPYSNLISGPQDYLYGTMSTITGWAIYRVKEDGTGFLRMHTLSEPQSRSFEGLTYVPFPLPEEMLLNDFTNKKYGDPAFDLVAVSTSGLPVMFTSSNPNVATISGNTATITGVGTTTITASQSGDGQFATAAPVSRTLTVSKGDQSITFLPISPLTFGAAPVDLVAASTSGLALSFSSSDTNVVTVSGQTITVVGGGTAVVTAKQTGNSNYEPAVDVQQTVTIAKADQVLTFNAIATKVLGDAPFAPSATTSSGLAVAFAPQSATLSINAGVVTLNSAGKGKVKATQAGNSNYNLVEEVQEFCINPVKPTITSNGLTLTSSASSGNQWYLDGTPLPVNNPTFTPTEFGTYRVEVVVDGCLGEPSADLVFVVTGDLLSQPGVRSIAPNPAADRIEVQLETFDPSTPVRINIYDLSGRNIDNFTTSTGTLSIDVSRYASGLYIVHTSLSGQVMKFMVTK